MAAIAAASVVAYNAHAAAMHAAARRWPLWELEHNLGWPSREHLRRIAEAGPSGCHRASCFPFRRLHARRLAYHPDRASYLQVQHELAMAARHRSPYHTLIAPRLITLTVP